MNTNQTGFLLSKDSKFVDIIYDKDEDTSVIIAINNLMTDLSKAFGISVLKDAPLKIYIKTIKDSSRNAFEEYHHFVKDGSLYIYGSDRRGTIYGIYELSELCGISPWYYFADVPPHAPASLFFEEGYSKTDSPTIPYRGIFINDEEELDKWARLHMNEPTIGVNTYEKVFELILRLKGNYIWPAMHVNSFNMYPECGALANKMGIVVGTSHCDMLMRSNFREWEPWIQKKGYLDAKYDYSFDGRNKEILKEYWRESAIQNKDFEVSYTLGMRGIHDSGFETQNLFADSEEELMDKKCALLEEVIADQNDLLKEVLACDTLKTFVPYKEVLNLYDRGLKVPEDITLIWTNDNYGYVRRYPSEAEKRRAGGNGIYYHCSYWAGTLRHYLFLSSIPIAKTKYEMEKAYENGIQKLWVCNMGAIKPLEQEMEFFIRLGYDYGKPDSCVNNAEDFLTDWVNKNFTNLDSRRIAKLLNKYARVSDARKVEFMEEDVFSQGPLVNEAAIRLNTLKSIFDELNAIYKNVKEDEKDAFFELILMKVHAAYYTSAMYYFADRSYLMSLRKNDGLANEFTILSKGFEDLRRKMLEYYNKKLAAGKWDGIVTPEDFPPPRTSMHPASVPGLSTQIGGTDVNELKPFTVHSFIASDCKLTDARIINDLGHATKSLVELSTEGSLELTFESKESEKLIIEIDRYPSLNSVGRIYTTLSVDGAEYLVETESTDEWRGTWIDNITDGVERLFVEVNLPIGGHTLTLHKSSKYFALSKIVIYENEMPDNRLGAIKPHEEDFEGDELPDRSYLKEANEVWYSALPTSERTIAVGSFVNDVSFMDLTDSYDYSKDKLFMPDTYLSASDLLNLGKELPTESDGCVSIEAFSAHNGYENAHEENVHFDYCTGVSYNRTNLALHIRKRGLVYNTETSPTLSYRFNCDGGCYTIYLLMKLDSRDNSSIHISVDGKPINSSWTNDSPWRYEAEKLSRYVPFVKMNIEKGTHVITISMLSSCIRIERILIKK